MGCDGVTLPLWGWGAAVLTEWPCPASCAAPPAGPIPAGAGTAHNSLGPRTDPRADGSLHCSGWGGTGRSVNKGAPGRAPTTPVGGGGCAARPLRPLLLPLPACLTSYMYLRTDDPA
jgi:hypothetical protein